MRYNCFCIVILADLCSQAGIIYSRNEYVDQLKMKPRKSMTERPYVFPRSQFKYGHYQNYLNWWVDRPLIMERSLRYPTGTFQHIIQDDFLKNTVPTVKKYDMDGLAGIVTPPGHCKMYELTTTWLKKAKVKDFLQLPEFSGGGGLDNRTYKYYDKVVKLTLASPSSFRIDGRVVISSYAAIRWGTPEKMKKLLDKLRKEIKDNFYFVVDIGAIIDRFIRKKMVRHNLKSEQAPKDELKKLKAKIHSWLEVSDGLLFAAAGHMNSHGNAYADKFRESYYRDLIIPVLMKVLNDPKYHGKKILGLSAAIGYTNFLSGINHSEMNTRRLRQTFESAMSAKPDFINLPEWNEVNENTCIQPTVSNGWSSQRIIKYFMSFLKGKKPTPNHGDDLSIPNMGIVISQNS